MAKLVSGALTEKYRIVKEGVEKIMGGKVIETEASRIYKQGGKDRLIEVAKAMLDDGLEGFFMRKHLKYSKIVYSIHNSLSK